MLKYSGHRSKNTHRITIVTSPFPDEIILLHAPGKHDQSQHGTRGSSKGNSEGSGGGAPSRDQMIKDLDNAGGNIDKLPKNHRKTKMFQRKHRRLNEEARTGKPTKKLDADIQGLDIDVHEFAGSLGIGL